MDHIKSELNHLITSYERSLKRNEQTKRRLDRQIEEKEKEYERAQAEVRNTQLGQETLKNALSASRQAEKRKSEAEKRMNNKIADEYDTLSKHKRLSKQDELHKFLELENLRRERQRVMAESVDIERDLRQAKENVQMVQETITKAKPSHK